MSTTREKSGSFENGCALFQKGTCAFAHVLGGKQTRKEFCLESQALLQRKVQSMQLRL